MHHFCCCAQYFVGFALVCVWFFLCLPCVPALFWLLFSYRAIVHAAFLLLCAVLCCFWAFICIPCAFIFSLFPRFFEDFFSYPAMVHVSCFAWCLVFCWFWTFVCTFCAFVMSLQVAVGLARLALYHTLVESVFETQPSLVYFWMRVARWYDFFLGGPLLNLSQDWVFGTCTNILLGLLQSFGLFPVYIHILKRQA